MHIVRVELDGFKSYAARTVISGFDPQFNAITGLNGSGKSNILDAICFVLGISNLTQVRVASLQELVYKQGQAGVQRASVIIVFDNTDKTQSPVGYESHDEISVERQVVIGGRNKYKINGGAAQLSQVQNLFHSVQLNVNNPHFLIMQGRITKVLNMKPPEILGMLEEAAGTRMFETKKQNALKTIEKKEAKKQECDRMIAEEITPNLERLRTQQATFLKWSANNTEIGRLERFCVAYDFTQHSLKVNQAAEELEQMENALQEQQDGVREMQKVMEDKDDEMREIAARKDDEIEERFTGAKQRADELSKALVKATTALTNKQSALAEEEGNLSSLREQLEAARTAAQEKSAAAEEAVQEANEASARANEKEAERNAMQDKFQNMMAGIADEGDDELRALPDRIASADRDAQVAQAAAETARVRAQHLRKAAADLAKELRAKNKEAAGLQRKHDKLQAECDAISQAIDELDYTEAREQELVQQRDAEQAAVEDLQDRVERLQAQLRGRLDFDFRNPSRNFDRSRVKGRVANLIQLNEAETSTALEVAAGGKLYQVVVDNDETGRQILEKGQLKKRVTLLPLNKMKPRVVSDRRVDAARAVAAEHGETANRALDLVSFEEELEPAIAHVFGNTLVCQTLAAANAIAFNVDIRTRTVTMEGDVSDPSGTLSGGSNNNLGSFLVKVCELDAARRELNARVERVQALTEALANMQQASARFAELQPKLELKQQELQMAGDRLLNAGVTTLQRRCEEAKAEQAEATQAVEDETRKHEEAVALGEQLRAEEAEHRDRREAAMLRVQDEVAEAKRAATEARERSRTMHQKHSTLQCEIKSLEEEADGLQEQVTTAEEAMEAIHAEVDKQSALVESRRAKYEQAQQQVEAVQAEVVACNNALKKLGKERRAAESTLRALTLEAKRTQNKLSRFNKDLEASRRAVQNMMRKYPWIADEQDFFGRPNTDYDFSGCSVEDAEEALSSGGKDGAEGAAEEKSSDAADDVEEGGDEDQEEEEEDNDGARRRGGRGDRNRGRGRVPRNRGVIASKRERLHKLQAEQEQLSKKINKKVMGMIEKAEQEYQDLLRKKEIIENDRRKIERVIEELDVKKRQALHTTWVKVNRDFGSIFSTLLPGTSAKLEPPEGCSVMDGLEVKVALGNVWKQSLAELSGGQRSLLALSLILALLLFKPAPMYILDEVDAALDLSHTQNIGTMLRTHFTHSQFIVVSLKEGMFNNANVIFRTRFVDGISTVTRTLGQGVSTGPAPVAALEDESPETASAAAAAATTAGAGHFSGSRSHSRSGASRPESTVDDAGSMKRKRGRRERHTPAVGAENA